MATDYSEQLQAIADALNHIARALNHIADEIPTPLQGERVGDSVYSGLGEIADAIREANGGSAASAE